MTPIGDPIRTPIDMQRGHYSFTPRDPEKKPTRIVVRRKSER